MMKLTDLRGSIGGRQSGYFAENSVKWCVRYWKIRKNNMYQLILAHTKRYGHTNVLKSNLRKFFPKCNGHGMEAAGRVGGRNISVTSPRARFFWIRPVPVICTAGCWGSAEYGKPLNLTFDEMDSIITQGKELGIYMYIYTGGEPLVRKRSDCIVQKAS
ncbi:MAG: hypothetical protein ACLR2O_08880 [Coprococcus sp.]